MYYHVYVGLMGDEYGRDVCITGFRCIIGGSCCLFMFLFCFKSVMCLWMLGYVYHSDPFSLVRPSCCFWFVINPSGKAGSMRGSIPFCVVFLWYLNLCCCWESNNLCLLVFSINDMQSGNTRFYFIVAMVMVMTLCYYMADLATIGLHSDLGCFWAA